MPRPTASKADQTEVPEAVDAETLLRFEAVTRQFETRTGIADAVGPIDLVIPRGQFVALVGGSGSGKTTLLRIAAGLLRPTRGRVIYSAAEVTGPIDDLGIVFQRPVLLDWRDVLRNITLQTEMRRSGRQRDREARALELLDQVGLAGYEHRYPWELSGGQQQRVALCRALIHEPSLLVMDEPFGAVDALTREQLQTDLERLWLRDRQTVLFVTHDVAEAVSLADRVIVLAGSPGRVAADVEIDAPRPRGGGLLESAELQNYALQVRAVIGGRPGR